MYHRLTIDSRGDEAKRMLTHLQSSLRHATLRWGVKGKPWPFGNVYSSITTNIKTISENEGMLPTVWGYRSKRFYVSGPLSSEQVRLLRQFIDGDQMLLRERMSVISIAESFGFSGDTDGVVKVLQHNGFLPKHCHFGMPPLPSVGLLDDERGQPGAALPHQKQEAMRLESQIEMDRILVGEICDPDASRRQDFTDMNAVTIDDESTTEIDDAVSCSILDDGGTQIWVHIADPTRWIAWDSVLGLEARRKCRTLYLPHEKIPMFPKILASEVFSLVQDTECCALSIGCILEPDGTIRDGSTKVAASKIVPKMKMTYDEVDTLLSGTGNGGTAFMLMAMHKAALARKAMRECNGAISLNMPESAIQVDVQKDIENISIKSISSEVGKSKQMVSEMMILAGEIVAQEGQHRGLALPYRGQEITVTPSEEELENAPNEFCRMDILRKYLLSSRSSSSGPQPHNGLGITAYVQATSPIRRFGDLLAHWQIKAALRGSSPPFDEIKLQSILDEMQEANRALNKYERNVSDFWVSKYFEKETSTNPNATWDGILVKWIHQDNGIAITFIESLGLEMIARIRAPARIGSSVTLQCTATAPDIQRVVLTDTQSQ